MHSPYNTNTLRYFSSDVFYMVIKSKIFIKCNAKNLTVETFVRIESRILMSIAYFWLEIIIYQVLLTLRESLLASSQHLPAPYSQWHGHC